MKFVEANKQKNNRGMALVSVLIVITLIGLLGSSILNLSYLAYQRKLVEKKDTENFYANEAVIDTIKSVLQNVAATALGEVDDTDDFAAAAKTDIENAVTSAGKSSLEEYLFDYVVNAMGTEVEEAITDTDAGGNGGSFSVGAMEISGDSLYIRDVVVEYVNDEGYTSKISTDIVINAPTYASDISVPIGSYSMFAGSGGSITSSAEVNTITAINNIKYNAQQGNVYFGSQDSTSTTSFELGNESKTVSYNMGSIFSVGGTNAVFNGDIILHAGSTLIFTGGDGTETCNIQVNGYIYLGAGSTLLLPPNVNLVCKGIMVYTYDSSGSVTGSVAYSYTDHSTVSEFYPVAKSVVSSSSIYTKYLYNEVDLADVLSETNALTEGNATDTRFKDIYNGAIYTDEYNNKTKLKYTSASAGVYMLDTAYTDAGWSRSISNEYKALTCTNGVWSCNEGLYSGYISNITCNENDSNLDQDEDVYYNGTYYDPAFWEFINVPVLAQTNENKTVSYCLTNYVSSTSDEHDNYCDVISYDNLLATYSDTSVYYEYSTNIIDNILWDNIGYTADNSEISYDITSRKFYKPYDTENYESVDWSNYTVQYNGTTYTPKSTLLEVSAISQTVGPEDESIAFCLNLTDIDVQLNEGTYIGLFMTNGCVNFTAGSKVCIGVSLLEMAKNITTNGLDDEDNDVRIFLEKFSTCITADVLNRLQYYTVDNTSAFKIAREFMLIDNLFNGGISTLWSTTSTSTSSGASSSVDNSSVNFVDTENWSKD